MFPLTPASPALAERIATKPLEVAVPKPVARTKEPPVPPVARPPVTLMDPPLSNAYAPWPSPPTMSTWPPTPPGLARLLPVPALMKTRPPVKPAAWVSPAVMSTSPPSR